MGPVQWSLSLEYSVTLSESVGMKDPIVILFLLTHHCGQRESSTSLGYALLRVLLPDPSRRKQQLVTV